MDVPARAAARLDGDRRLRVENLAPMPRKVITMIGWDRNPALVVNVAFAGSPAWIVCPYDTRVLPSHIVDDVRRTHPQLVTGPGAEPGIGRLLGYPPPCPGRPRGHGL